MDRLLRLWDQLRAWWNGTGAGTVGGHWWALEAIRKRVSGG